MQPPHRRSRNRCSWADASRWAFVLAILLVETGWLKLAQGLPIASGYAVTATQWLLTAIFSVIFGVQRAFHLDEMCDLGFALVTDAHAHCHTAPFNISSVPFPNTTPSSSTNAVPRRSETAGAWHAPHQRGRAQLAALYPTRGLGKGQNRQYGPHLKAEELVWPLTWMPTSGWRCVPIRARTN